MDDIGDYSLEKTIPWEGNSQNHHLRFPSWNHSYHHPTCGEKNYLWISDKQLKQAIS